MTKDDAFNLDLSKLYKFEFYTGQTLIGILDQDYGKNEYCIIKASDLIEYRDSQLSKEDKIKAGIMKPVNIENIDYWEEFKR